MEKSKWKEEKKQRRDRNRGQVKVNECPLCPRRITPRSEFAKRIRNKL